MRATIVALVLTLTSFAVAADTERKSVDGVTLPAVEPSAFKTSGVPFVGSMIGAEPERYSRNILNLGKSLDAFTKRTGQKDSAGLKGDWFVVGGSGADVAMLDLWHGRIRSISLIYVNLNNARAAKLASHIPSGKIKGAVVSSRRVARADGGSNGVLVISADTVEWYVSDNQVDPKIAAALRDRKYLPEMNDEQADMIGDGPGLYLVPYFAPVQGGGVAVDSGIHDVVGDPLGLSRENKKVCVRGADKEDVRKKVKDKGWVVGAIEKLPRDTTLTEEKIPQRRD